MDNKQKHKKIWQTVKKSIKTDMPSQVFNTWITPIKPVALNEYELILEVPNQFFYEWLDTHYKDTINRKALDAKGRPLNIKYTVSTEKKRIKNYIYKETEKQKYKPKSLTFINKNQRFNSFIEGPNNQFARAAAMSVAQNPGASHYNPLVIYGGVGLGKTHLLHAIGNHSLA